MIDQQHLDIRTITMGISLLDCADPDPKAACREDLRQDLPAAHENLVATGEAIEKEFGIPIVNKRISVTPISLVAARQRHGGLRSLCRRPWTGPPKPCGVNFIGGFSALVQKGMTQSDRKLIALHPRGPGHHRPGVLLA